MFASWLTWSHSGSKRFAAASLLSAAQDGTMKDMSERTLRRPRERELSEAESEARRRALEQIRVLGDPVLREKAHVVEAFDGDLAKLTQRMFTIMDDAPGIGLAATQIGVVQRVLVYRVDESHHVLVNPVLSDPSDETEVVEEGCLSVPGVVVPVGRPVRIHVRARDARGARLDFIAEDLEARVIQHETDHLNGILILERTTKAERARALRELREAALTGTR